MIWRVRKYIRENHMLKAGDMVAAGVSGGADSIAMLHILKEIQRDMALPWRLSISIMESAEKKPTGMKSW